MTEEGKAPLTEESAESKNFILNFIDEDIAEGGRFQGLTVHTRFPPEPMARAVISGVTTCSMV